MKPIHIEGKFCEISIWLHGHFETKELLEIELFGVTKMYGGRLDKGWFELIEKALGDERNDFASLPKERAYIAEVHLGFEFDEPYFTFYNIRLDDVIQNPEVCDATTDGNSTIADQINKLYHQLKDCPLKEHLRQWFDYTLNEEANTKTPSIYPRWVKGEIKPKEQPYRSKERCCAKQTIKIKIQLC